MNFHFTKQKKGQASAQPPEKYWQLSRIGWQFAGPVGRLPIAAPSEGVPSGRQNAEGHGVAGLQFGLLFLQVLHGIERLVVDGKQDIFGCQADVLGEGTGFHAATPGVLYRRAVTAPCRSEGGSPKNTKNTGPRIGVVEGILNTVWQSGRGNHV